MVGERLVAADSQCAVTVSADVHFLAGSNAQFAADSLGDYNLVLFGNGSFHDNTLANRNTFVNYRITILWGGVSVLRWIGEEDWRCSINLSTYRPVLVPDSLPSISMRAIRRPFLLAATTLLAEPGACGRWVADRGLGLT